MIHADSSQSRPAWSYFHFILKSWDGCITCVKTAITTGRDVVAAWFNITNKSSIFY